jgi:parvulin-like peptidyl-prolyl isomerase
MKAHLLPIALSLALSACGALATSPSWVGGGMAVTGPLRLHAAEAQAEANRQQRAREPDTIAARHILVMYRDSKGKPPGLTRTRAEAQQRAQECLLKLRSGADFSETVRHYSDEPGAPERGGDLGSFRREVMVSSFSDAAFSLKVGETSEVIETPYGFHVIHRYR